MNEKDTGNYTTDEKRPFSRFLFHPITGFVAAVAILLSGILISVLLDRAGTIAIMAACLLLATMAIISLIVGFVAAREVFLTGVNRMLDSFNERLEIEVASLRAVLDFNHRHISSFVQSGGSSQSEHLGLATDAQFALLEAGPSVRAVILVLKNIGTEFQDELAERKTLIDYEQIVTDNLRRGVSYTYVTEQSVMNMARMRRAARKIGNLNALMKMVALSQERWAAFPFLADTIFLLDVHDDLEGFMLLPNGADKTKRSWVRLSADECDRWWGLVEPLLPEAKLLSTLLTLGMMLLSTLTLIGTRQACLELILPSNSDWRVPGRGAGGAGRGQGRAAP